LAAFCVIAIGIIPDSTQALGMNSAMFYRYPFADGEARPRTQGQFGSVSHREDNLLQHAVDWAHNIPQTRWIIRSASEGMATCYEPGEGGTATTFGAWVAVYNPVADQTAIYAHRDNCVPFTPLEPFPVKQGDSLGEVGELGCGGFCVHLHFQVNEGDNQTGTLTSAPFAMSDKDSFLDSENTEDCDDANADCVQDGPSDNAGTGFLSTSPDSIDTALRDGYGAAGGWWSIGATYRSTIELNDEWGGVCRNTLTRFAHLCASDFGTGIAVNQNYIGILGVRRSVYRTGTTAREVRGQIQGALSNLFGGANRPLSRTMGAPLGAENAAGRQDFEAGYLQRNNGPGVRIDAFVCGSFGCGLLAVLRYSAYGEFCPSVNPDKKVSSIDLSQIAQRFGTNDIAYDINGDGTVSSIDLSLTSSRLNVICETDDPEPD
jgi:hypothetical protein